MKIEQSYRSEHGLLTIVVESKSLDGHSMLCNQGEAMREIVQDAITALLLRTDFDEKVRQHMRSK
jgi:hypothetical protein